MTILRDDKMGGDARVKGNRIAVYHVVQYREAGYGAEDIAVEFGLEVDDVVESLECVERTPRGRGGRLPRGRGRAEAGRLREHLRRMFGSHRDGEVRR